MRFYMHVNARRLLQLLAFIDCTKHCPALQPVIPCANLCSLRRATGSTIQQTMMTIVSIFERGAPAYAYSLSY